MRSNIRLGLAAAMAAVAISAGNASATPVWFDAADTNGDGQVTWNEYRRTDKLFDALDENGDRKITTGEHYGRGTMVSSWESVFVYDRNRDGSVNLYEYTVSLKDLFNSFDANQDGVLSDRETA